MHHYMIANVAGGTSRKSTFFGGGTCKCSNESGKAARKIWELTVKHWSAKSLRLSRLETHRSLYKVSKTGNAARV